MNSLTHSQSQTGAPAVSVSRSLSLQWPLLRSVPRSAVWSWHRTGLGHQCGQRGPSQPRVSGSSPFPLFVCSVFRNSQFHSHLQPPPLLSGCVTVQFFFTLPRQSIYLWLASFSRAAPGVEWRAVGGRARELSTWRSGPSHVGMTPSMCAHTLHTCRHKGCWLDGLKQCEVMLTDFKLKQWPLFDHSW